MVHAASFHVAVTALALTIAVATAAEDRSRFRDVLLIAVDDMRPEIGCYGCKHMVSRWTSSVVTIGMHVRKKKCGIRNAKCEMQMRNANAKCKCEWQ